MAVRPAFACLAAGLLFALPVALALAGAPPRAATQPAAGEAVPAGAASAAEAPDRTDAAHERLERMRGTGSRAGFDHDTRPSGKLAAQGQRKVTRHDAEGEVAPRPTRWREQALGGTTVREVRFRRRGEADGDGR